MASPDHSISPQVRAALAAAERSPRSPAAWEALADAFGAAGQLEASVQAWEQRVRLDPADARGWAGLSLALRKTARRAQAPAAARQAVQRAPQAAWLWANLSAISLVVDDVAGAVEASGRAVALDAGDVEAWGARCNALAAAGDLPGALAAADRAAEIAPDDPRPAWCRALALLAAGEWEAGWPAYEARLRRPGARRPPAPWWDGRPISGGLLVTVEQGIGDTVQLLHLLGRARERVGHLSLALPEGLHAAFAQIPGVDAVIDERSLSGLPAGCVAAVALPSLPALLALRPEGAAQGVPALSADPAAVLRWRARLAAGAPHARMRVGLCWQGNPSYEADFRRSPGVRALAPLAAVEGVAWFSLQKVHGALRDGPEPPLPIIDLDEELDQGGAFVDTIPCLAALDLLITSDTAMAHLAGQLGRPVWVGLAAQPDWRWGRSGATCPWYPSMRLFRQAQPGDWAGVFGEMARALMSVPGGAA